MQSDTRREIEALHEVRVVCYLSSVAAGSRALSLSLSLRWRHQQTRDVVLGSGKKALQAYCTLLITKKHVAEEEEAQATVAMSSPSSPTARTKSSNY